MVSFCSVIRWLHFVRRCGFPALEKALRAKLQEHFPRPEPNLSLGAGELEQIELEMAEAAAKARPKSAAVAVSRIHLFVTSKSNLFIREIAELICAGFWEAGYDAQLFEQTNGSKGRTRRPPRQPRPRLEEPSAPNWKR